MQYRLGLIQDFPAITDFVNSRDYFMPLDPTTLGGTWLIAEHDGIVHGTLWFFMGAGNAYIDYWAADSALVAARLGAMAEQVLAMLDVKHVHAVIYSENKAARRLADAMGMASAGDGYTLVYRRL